MSLTWRIVTGSALDCLQAMSDASVQCCVTSPPYWGLRDYGVDGQLGLETTPDEVGRMNANAWYNRKGKPYRLSEKQEQAAIVQLLESLGAKVYILGTRRPKGDHPGTCMTPGIPDLWVFMPPLIRCGRTPRPPIAIWIEVKRQGGTLRPTQVEFQSLCRQAAHHHIVGTCDDVQNWLVDHGWLKADQRRSA